MDIPRSPKTPHFISLIDEDELDLTCIPMASTSDQPLLSPPATCSTQPANVDSLSRFLSNEVKIFKKNKHNMVERKRRQTINDGIKELGELLPSFSEARSCDGDPSRRSKGSILKSAIDYLKYLKEEKERLARLEIDHRRLEIINDNLSRRNKELEKEFQHRRSQQQCYRVDTQLQQKDEKGGIDQEFLPPVKQENRNLKVENDIQEDISSIFSASTSSSTEEFYSYERPDDFIFNELMF